MTGNAADEPVYTYPITVLPLFISVVGVNTYVPFSRLLICASVHAIVPALYLRLPRLSVNVSDDGNGHVPEPQFASPQQHATL